MAKKDSEMRFIEKEFDALHIGIKKLLEDAQEEKFEELDDRIKKRIEERLSDLAKNLETKVDGIKKERVDLARFLKEIRINRERIVKIEGALGSLESKSLGSGMMEDIHREFDKIREGVKLGAVKNAESLKKLEAEVANIAESMNGSNETWDALKKFDAGNVARDIESLKQKALWLEENIEKIDIQPLFDKIRGLEEEIRETKNESPLVIE